MLFLNSCTNHNDVNKPFSVTMEARSALNDTRAEENLISSPLKRLKTKKNILKVSAIDENKFECLICENIYESILKLRIHVIVDHNGRKEVGKLPFMCKKCGLLYPKRSSLNQHYLKQHPTVYFKGKPKQSYTPVLVEVHKEVVETAAKDTLDDFVKVQRTFVEQRYRCDLCNVICKNKAAIRHHKISKHTEQNDWKCLECNYTSKFKQYYVRHIANKHTDLNATLTKTTKHICEVCGYSTHVKGHLEAHRQTHLQNKNYMCEICGRRTKTKNAMISHRRMHLKDKSYTCGINDCQFKTVYLTSLKHHRLSHDPEKNTLYCDMCNFKTFNKYMLNTHIEQHKRGEKIFKCSICDFSTAQNVNLKHHMHKHSKEKKFNCNFCSISYKYENSLRKHLKKHSSNEQKDNDNGINNFDNNTITKSNIKFTKQSVKVQLDPENFINSETFEKTQNKETTLVNQMKSDINNSNCYEGNVKLLGNCSANKNHTNPSIQYAIHNNQQYSSVVIHEFTSDQSYSNHSENQSNSFVQNNVAENQYNQPNIANKRNSSNIIENQIGYIHYNTHNIHEDNNKFVNDKSYQNQLQTSYNSSPQCIHNKLNSNETRNDILNEENCSQLVNQNSFIQYNVDSKPNLYNVKDSITNNSATYFNQIESHSNSSVNCNVVEKHIFNETRNIQIISEMSTNQKNGDRSNYINEENSLNKPPNSVNCLDSNSSLALYSVHENDTSTKDSNDLAKNQITGYNNSNKSFSDGVNDSFETNLNSNEMKVLNPIGDHRIFSDGRNINLSRNFVNTKHNSNQLQSSNNNSFILYDICDRSGQIELRNDSNSFVDQSSMSQRRHQSTPFTEYPSDTHGSNEDSFTTYHNLEEGLDLNKSKSNKDSANAIEIVVNKGVLMMSVDCGALSSMENFDYFED